MGLSGRKEKQRIGADPRNLTWADDASKFGASYLSKFGWDASAGVGLGAAGDGMTSHIKVSQKLDMMGIGAAHQKDPNGIAWKQNKDYENLLKRLNDNHVPAATTTEVVEEVEADSDSPEAKAERKRKRKAEKEEKKASKRRKAVIEEAVVIAIAEEKPVEPRKALVPRHRAHRARAIAAKSFSSHSSSSIAEILGISSNDTSAAPTPQLAGSLTPTTPDEQQRDEEQAMHKLTTSTKSVADYFKDRLLAKKATTSSPLAVVTPPSPDADDEDHSPRGGLGMGGLGFRPATATTTDDDASTTAAGISKFGSLMSSMFLAAASSEPSPPEANMSPEAETGSEDPSSKKKRKRKDSAVTTPDIEDTPAAKEKSKKSKRSTPIADADEEAALAKKEKRKRKAENSQETTDEVAEEKEDKEERRRRKAEKKARKAAAARS